MTTAVAVGFQPVPAGEGKGASFAAAAEADPLGVFGVLLDAIAGNKAKVEGTIAGTVEQALAVLPDGLPVPALTLEVPAEPKPAEGDTPLLGTLGDLLGALDTALEAGETVDPVVAQKLDETLAALYALLGIAPPETAPVGTDAVAPRVLVDGAEVPQAPAPDSLLARLAARIEEIAADLKPAHAGVAEKLAALAERLKAGEIDAEVLAKLGLPTDIDVTDAELDAFVDTLLGGRPEARPVAPAPIFTTPQLALPEIVLPPTEKPVLKDKPPLAPTAPDGEPNLDVPEAPRISMSAPKADAGDGAEAKAKPAFAASVAAASGQADAGAEPVQVQQPGAAATTTSAQAIAVPAGARAIHAAYQAPVQVLNLPQIAFEIARQFQAGSSRFQIRLDPPELGRIDVKLDVDASGNISARMVVERSETLDLMQRDQRALERALAQAGLDQGKTNLEFSLRQNPFAHDERAQGGGRDGGPASPLFGGETEEPATADIVTQYRGTATAGGVNLFV